MAPNRAKKKKRRSGVPTGNAGEYFVMGELLKRGFDAQLADRNTKGYDLLVGRPDDKTLRKVQVKSVRAGAWYVNLASYKGNFLEDITIYVLVGRENGRSPVRYFIAKNREVAAHVSKPKNWTSNGHMRIKYVAQYENRWDLLRSI